MTKTQQKLITEAYRKEVDADGFRERMDAWLDAKTDNSEIDWSFLRLLPDSLFKAP